MPMWSNRIFWTAASVAGVRAVDQDLERSATRAPQIRIQIGGNADQGDRFAGTEGFERVGRGRDGAGHGEEGGGIQPGR
jgi:hypothetical protein